MPYPRLILIISRREEIIYPDNITPLIYLSGVDSKDAALSVC